MSESLITKKALADSLKELMLRRPLDKISVGEICEGCGMNRKSFYYHFKDKYDLVNWIFYFEFLSRLRSDGFDTPWDFFGDVTRYFYENRRFYIAAFAVSGQNSFSEYFGDVFQPLAQEYLAAEFGDGEDNQYYANFFTDAFRVAIIRWLREEPQLTPEKIVELFKKAAYGVGRRYGSADNPESANQVKSGGPS